jgi:hypothetical protein
MSGSKQLLRANPALTANYKLVVTSDYKLFLESYDSNAQLSDVKYKRFAINEEAYLSERLPKFFAGMPAKTAFEVRKHTDTDAVQEDFGIQMDDIYWAGAAAVEDSRYKEEHEFVAPLWIDKNRLPAGFVVLRIDGPGNYDLNSSNFRKNIIEKWKCVRLFDLSVQTPFGRFLDKNYKSNKYFPTEPFELNLKKYQFSKWNGIDYNSGGYCSKSFFLSDTVEEETTHFETEEFITDGFKNNEVIMAHKLNVKFLFDDTPGIVLKDKTYKRKWSMNRYLGFYLDELELIMQVSPVQQPSLKPNVVLIDNQFSENPLQVMWRDETPVYIKRGDKFLHVKRFDTPIGSSYRIIDDQINNDINTLNPEQAIKIEQGSDNKCYVRYRDGSPLKINNHTSNDLYLIEILGQYHTLIPITIGNKTEFYINSDLLIKTNNKTIEIKGYDKNLVSYDYLKIKEEDGPITFKVYKAKFTELADFDFDRIDTQYSRYEYEQNTSYSTIHDYTVTGPHNPLVSTLEPKLFARNEDGTLYAEPSTYIFGDVSNPPAALKIPVSSEYVAGRDLWALRDRKLSPIWSKNQYVCKWGFLGSISHADYPYKINNSASISGNTNRTPDPSVEVVQRRACNLDWFYTIGRPLNKPASTADYPAGLEKWTPASYNFRSLEIDVPSYNGDTHFWMYNYFNLDLYANSDTKFDYFEWFFTRDRKDRIIGNDVRNFSKKYAVFGVSDEVNGPICLFRGIKAAVLKTLPDEPEQNTNLLTEPMNEFVGYKFSTVLTKQFTSKVEEYGTYGITVYCNKLWKNILIAIWVKVPHNSLTNIESTQRDNIYKSDFVTYQVMDGVSAPVSTTLNIADLTIAKIIKGLNSVNSIDDKIDINYKIIDSKSEYSTVSSSAPNALLLDTYIITLNTNMDIKVGEYLDFSKDDVLIKNVKVKSINTTTMQSDNGVLDTKVIIEYPVVGIDFKYYKVSKSQYKIPFVISALQADDIKILKNSKVITFDGVDLDADDGITQTLTPHINIPDNSTITINKGDALVKSVYTNMPITGELENKYPNPEVEANYETIKRFSGSYTPILKSIPMFNSSNFNIIEVLPNNINFSQKLFNGKYYVKCEVPISAKIEVGDYVYITANPTVASDFNSYKIYEVIEISNLEAGFNYKSVILNFEVTDDFISLGNMAIMKFVPANTKFDAGLNNFGVMTEVVISKVFDTSKPVLKTGITDVDTGKTLDSIYPMLDEHGVSTVNRFIFKSCWDTDFYSKTELNLNYYTK